MFLYIVSSFTQNEWFLTILSCHATSVEVLPLCCNTKDGPVPPGPPLSWKPSNIRGSAWGEEVDVESCFLIVEIGEVHWRLGPGNSNFMDEWAERSLEGFGIYIHIYIYTIKMKKNNSVVKDKYFEFTCRVVFFCIHQIGHTLFHVLFSSIFWETCLNLPQLTCRVCGSGHDSLEKGGNFRHQTTPSCSTSRVKQETQGVKSKINTGTSNFRTPRTLKFG